MANSRQALHQVGLQLPDIWLPTSGVDPQRWAVIACDQHTSDPDYWRRVEEYVGDAPSTLRLIFPEVYLQAPDRTRRMEAVSATMQQYVQDGVLENRGPMAVLVDRATPQVERRTGLLLAIDLERYDFAPDSRALIRATEGTILDRLPPRVEIRRQAEFELPHVLVLIDDPDHTVIEPLWREREQLERLYQTDLMFGGGRMTGYAVRDEQRLQRLAGALAALMSPDRLRQRYGRDDAMLFAVGDGNHSLATARQVWEEKKAASTSDKMEADPARFALVEILNMHDPGLHVEPIHRVVEGLPSETLLTALTAAAGSEPEQMQSSEAAARVLQGEANRFALVDGDETHCFTLSDSGAPAAAVVVQLALERLESEFGSRVSIDYIHGTEALLALSNRESTLGLLVPPIQGESLFHYVANNGPLPRKIFSLGEAEEKRYYFESRRIV